MALQSICTGVVSDPVVTETRGNQAESGVWSMTCRLIFVRWSSVMFCSYGKFTRGAEVTTTRATQPGEHAQLGQVDQDEPWPGRRGRCQLLRGRVGGRRIDEVGPADGSAAAAGVRSAAGHRRADAVGHVDVVGEHEGVIAEEQQVAFGVANRVVGDARVGQVHAADDLAGRGVDDAEDTVMHDYDLAPVVLDQVGFVDALLLRVGRGVLRRGGLWRHRAAAGGRVVRRRVRGGAGDSHRPGRLTASQVAP
jgi:hypothetical protein